MATPQMYLKTDNFCLDDVDHVRGIKTDAGVWMGLKCWKYESIIIFKLHESTDNDDSPNTSAWIKLKLVVFNPI